MRVTLSSTLLHQARECVWERVFLFACVCLSVCVVKRDKERDTDRPCLIIQRLCFAGSVSLNVISVIFDTVLGISCLFKASEMRERERKRSIECIGDQTRAACD